MAQIVSLDAVPNQRLNFNLDNVSYRLTLKTIITGVDEGITLIDILANGEGDSEVEVNGLKCTIGNLLIPYRYLYSQNGNFIFIPIKSDDFDLPYYTNFGTSQFLVALTQAESNAFGTTEFNSVVTAPSPISGGG